MTNFIKEFPQLKPDEKQTVIGVIVLSAFWFMAIRLFHYSFFVTNDLTVVFVFSFSFAVLSFLLAYPHSVFLCDTIAKKGGIPKDTESIRFHVSFFSWLMPVFWLSFFLAFFYFFTNSPSFGCFLIGTIVPWLPFCLLLLISMFIKILR